MKKIMFSDAFSLTKAVVSGRKTKTRRIITCPKRYHGVEVRGFYVKRNVAGNIVEVCMYDEDERDIDGGLILPKYKVGEVVAVAQSYASILDELEDPKNYCNMGHWELDAPKRAYYAGFLYYPGMTNKMFVSADEMIHQIRIANVRVERLQDISDEDCIKEGIGISATDNRIGTPFGIPFNYFVGEDKKGCRYSTPREAYAALIDKISGKGTWQSNPYVFAYEFELIK